MAYNMAKQGNVSIKVWNMTAEPVCGLNEFKPAGPQTSQLTIDRCATGVYLYRVQMAYDDGTVETLPLKRFVVAH